MTTSTSRSHRGKPRSISDNFRKLFNLFGSKDRILVTIDADPDSMASAMAQKRILWRRVHTVTIAHFNEIRRFDNHTMKGNIFSYTGRVHSQDTVVLVADFFIKCHEVNWTVVFGIHRKN